MKSKVFMKIIKSFLVVFLLCVFNTVLFARNAEPPPLDEYTHVPIDGGVSVLIGAGIAYAVKKLYYRDDTKDL